MAAAERDRLLERFEWQQRHLRHMGTDMAGPAGAQGHWGSRRPIGAGSVDRGLASMQPVRLACRLGKAGKQGWSNGECTVAAAPSPRSRTSFSSSVSIAASLPSAAAAAVSRWREAAEGGAAAGEEARLLGGGGAGSLPSAIACGDEDLTTGVILIWSAASARACVRC